MVDPWCKLFAVALFGIVLFQDTCLAQKPPNYTFMHEATRAPGASYYDYIVIGGGTAGCPLAATLSQKYSVLLLERGGSPYGNANITQASNYGAFFSDTSPDAVTQQFISEDGVVLARARVLGGGTSINAGFYTRGEVEFARDAGFDEKLVNQSYEWVEKTLVSNPNVRQWQSAFRDALLDVGVVPYNGLTYDHLIGTKVSGSIFDENGTRHTAADLLQFADPKGLTLLLNASVQKILFRNNKGKSRPTAYGVVFEDASGNMHKAYLKGGPKDEIFLSAGAIGSPHLLMLSGLGPKDQLEAQKIKVVLDQPLVGQGMGDNPLSIVFVPSPSPVEVSFVNVVGITEFGSYIEGGSGLNLIGGRPADFRPYSPERGAFIFEKINGPISRGDLKLRNANPVDNPSVTFNYFKENIDLQKCVRGVSTILALIESKAFSKFTYPNMTSQDILNFAVRFPTSLPTSADTTSTLEQFCKDTVRTIYHYHGGCHVGKVVDRDYKVLGVDALRVIDGSTFHRSPGSNPQATVMMIGRYMGVKILSERLAGSKSK